MAKALRYEQLDRAVQELLAGKPARLPKKDAELATLVRVASELRAMPRESFRMRLRDELEKEAGMPKAKAVARKEQSVIPYLVVGEPLVYADFLKQAFGADEALRTTGSAGGWHIELNIGDSKLMMGGPKRPDRSFAVCPAALHLYVPDADAVYRRAVAAGATSLYAPMDQPYGDREAGVRDAAGNVWYIATHKGGDFIRPGMASITITFHPSGADRMMEFLEKAFGAEEVAAHKSPEGAVLHVQMRIGNSMVELGEAHGAFQPMATMVLLSVDDADAAYNRAMAAGAEPIETPADQPYGARRAGVKDPFGNTWYVSSPLPRGRKKSRA